MFKNWGSWLGKDNENGQVKESVVDDNEHKDHGINKAAAGADGEPTGAVKEDAQLLLRAKGFSGKFDKAVNFVVLVDC